MYLHRKQLHSSIFTLSDNDDHMAHIRKCILKEPTQIISMDYTSSQKASGEDINYQMDEMPLISFSSCFLFNAVLSSKNSWHSIFASSVLLLHCQKSKVPACFTLPLKNVHHIVYKLKKFN